MICAKQAGELQYGVVVDASSPHSAMFYPVLGLLFWEDPNEVALYSKPASLIQLAARRVDHLEVRADRSGLGSVLSSHAEDEENVWCYMSPRILPHLYASDHSGPDRTREAE